MKKPSNQKACAETCTICTIHVHQFANKYRMYYIESLLLFFNLIFSFNVLTEDKYVSLLS